MDEYGTVLREVKNRSEPESLREFWYSIPTGSEIVIESSGLVPYLIWRKDRSYRLLYGWCLFKEGGQWEKSCEQSKENNVKVKMTIGCGVY